MTKRTETVPDTTGEAKPSPPATASKGALPTVSGSGPGEWNSRLLNDVVAVCCGGDLGDTAEVRAIALKKARAGIAAMQGIGPDDVIGDMVAAQLVAAHEAAMACYKRAAGAGGNGEAIPLEFWREYMNQANKLSRTSAALIEALNRHRGKSGQQTVRVEYVTVKDGGQAVIGPVTTGGEGG